MPKFLPQIYCLNLLKGVWLRRMAGVFENLQAHKTDVGHTNQSLMLSKGIWAK